MSPMETPRALRLAKDKVGRVVTFNDEVSEIGVNGRKVNQGGGEKGDQMRRRVTLLEGEEERAYNTSVFTKSEEEQIRRGKKIEM